MDYAAQQDIIDRYGSDALLLVADRDNDSIIDADVVSKAISDASDEIDVYVAAKYDLPLATVPPVLVRLCVDIVMYRLSFAADIATEEWRIRFDDAITLLEKIGRGVVSLGLDEAPDSNNGDVTTSSNGRLFSRASMKGVL